MIRPQALINGRYRVGRRLGDGGMAIVYLGHDLLLGRDVAIKTLRPQFAADEAFRTRFEREARAAASLSHPNIIDVYDVGEEDGLPFIVMELVRGQSLKSIIAAEAPFHPDDVAELMTQVGAALDHAHLQGYVHRDVKPGNILVDEHGRARVVDFGIAKGLADADLTDAGGGLGTAAYLSPEQAEGLMATPSSDIYAAGVIAFEMLTGDLPFRADTPVGVAMRHVNDAPPAPSRIAAGVPLPVDAVVLRALAKDPTRRWPSVGAFAQALRGWRAEGVPVAQAAPRAASTPSPASGSLVPTVAVIVLVVAALAALLWTGLRGAPPVVEEETPTVLAPVAPVITGAVDTEEPAVIAPAPTATALPTPAPTPAAVDTLAPAPTIAPAIANAVTVPNLQGLSIADATGTLLPLGLNIALGEIVWSESAPMNVIVAQDPPPGAAVAPGEVVHVTLSRGPSPFLDGDNP